MEYNEQENEKMHKMLLSPHFALGEFIKSGTAMKNGVDNTPPRHHRGSETHHALREDSGTSQKGVRCYPHHQRLQVPPAQSAGGRSYRKSARTGRGCRHLRRQQRGAAQVHGIHPEKLRLRPDDSRTARTTAETLAARQLYHATAQPASDSEITKHFKSSNTMKKDTIKTIIKIALAVLTAIATSLGFANTVN